MNNILKEFKDVIYGKKFLQRNKDCNFFIPSHFILDLISFLIILNANVKGNNEHFLMKKKVLSEVFIRAKENI